MLRLMGVSAPSLHRESTDSLIHCVLWMHAYNTHVVCMHACTITSHLSEPCHFKHENEQTPL